MAKPSYNIPQILHRRHFCHTAYQNKGYFGFKNHVLNSHCDYLCDVRDPSALYEGLVYTAGFHCTEFNKKKNIRYSLLDPAWKSAERRICLNYLPCSMLLESR